MKTLTINSKTIRYTVEGKGNCIILLHGYLESGLIWGEFAENLAKTSKVIIPDLPGHGKSDYLASVHTMELMAETIDSILVQEAIDKCFIIGHSMGGYVSLAFAKRHPEKLKGLILLHSHPFVDSVQKQFDRDREAGFIKLGRKNLLINLKIPENFAYDNHVKFKKEIGKCIAIAHNTENEGMLAALQGMKVRTDKSDVLKQKDFPVLWILGKKDILIDSEPILRKEKEYKPCKIRILENSGHMGFIEEIKNCLIFIADFIYANS